MGNVFEVSRKKSEKSKVPFFRAHAFEEALRKHSESIPTRLERKPEEENKNKNDAWLIFKRQRVSQEM